MTTEDNNAKALALLEQENQIKKLTSLYDDIELRKWCLDQALRLVFAGFLLKSEVRAYTTQLYKFITQSI